MNRREHVARSLPDAAADADEAVIADAYNANGQKGFAPLREDDLPAFSRQLLMLRPEPVFMDIFKPLPYQTSAQFMDYFSAGKRPLWVMGRPESPSAYFALHHMQRPHDLANLDFVYFFRYPSPGSATAHYFWNYVRNRLGERGLTRIQSFVIGSSVEKIRLLESFGFRQEGVLREHYFHNGELHDIVVQAWMTEGRRV